MNVLSLHCGKRFQGSECAQAPVLSPHCSHGNDVHYLCCESSICKDIQKKETYAYVYT